MARRTPEPYPLSMQGSLVQRPWGGGRIAALFGVDDRGSVGESWEVSALPGAPSRVANGPLAGETLAAVHGLWGAELTGAQIARRHGRRFPLLVKLVDAEGRPSVQVHPDDRQALRLEGSPDGKCEAWYVLEAAPEARGWLGLREGVDRARFLAALSRGSVEPALAERRLSPGDCVLLEPGTLHACGGGLLFLEIQQPSEVTYRVFDWGRARELHLDKALEVVDIGARPRVTRAPPAAGSPASVEHPLVAGAQFAVTEIGLHGATPLRAGEAVSTLTAVAGECLLGWAGGEAVLARGRTAVVPAGVACVLEAVDTVLVRAVARA